MDFHFITDVLDVTWKHEVGNSKLIYSFNWRKLLLLKNLALLQDVIRSEKRYGSLTLWTPHVYFESPPTKPNCF